MHMTIEVNVISNVYVLPSNNFYLLWRHITEISKAPLKLWIVKMKIRSSFTYCCVDGEVEDKLSFLTKE